MYKLSRHRCIFAFDKYNAAGLVVDNGDTVQLQTADYFANQIKTAADNVADINRDWICPATGPVYVEGAEAGDALKVTVEKIDIWPQGIVVDGAGQITVKETAGFQVNKIIGVIGVAPAGAPAACGAAGRHGGNLRGMMIGEGISVCFPVAVSGALFAAGDVRAVCSGSESGPSDICVMAFVTVKLDVLKGMRLTEPCLENNI